MSKNLFQQFQKIWRQTSIPARFSIIATCVLCIALIGGVGYWSAQPHYVPLATNLEPDDASEIKARLDENAIPNRLNYSGSAVLVDQSRLNQARLLVSNIVGQSHMPTESISSSWINDPSTKDFRMARQLEIRLAATISKFQPIEQAWVNLGIPSPEPFLRDRQEKTASVVVQLRPGASFSPNLTRTIVSTIARSVEGLDAKNVSVSDTSGHTISGDQSGFGGTVSSQIEYQQQVERYLSDKAEYVLEQMLGPGRAVVRVAAEVDFTQLSMTKTSYDPDARAKKTQKIESTKGTKENPTPAGPAGSSTNLGNGLVTQEETKLITSTEMEETTYENSLITENRTEHPGEIRRLTVAAMVQLDEDSANNENGIAAPAAKSNVSKEEVERIVKQAVGFNTARGDEIEVLITELAETQLIDDMLLAPPPVDTWGPIVRNASLGVAALVALVLGWLTLKRIRPLTIYDSNPSQITPQRARQISDLVTLVRQHPELVSNIMSAWVNDSRTDSRNSAESKDEKGREAA